MTYIENEPPKRITRAEAREIAEIAWAILDSDPSDYLREVAKNVISWVDGTLLFTENDAWTVKRVIPFAFNVCGWYTRNLQERFDLTPQAVLDANPIYVAMLERLAGFLDNWIFGGPTYSDEARLEALQDYDRYLARLQQRTAEYVAEVAAEEAEKADDGTDEDESHIERSTNHGAHE
ncbi:hypothetical protein [Mycobacterium simiae]|uniref:hypothetical protein n=1 Tax=Mycobacterium simiae TaxID=1784 RepID=UPI0005C900D4|nr:hypothetical protein [Mycobacterium simiae]PLV44941.1 hypothetical protein X011_25630 [Mycobacterium tuberculosis variant microti OV254]BBX38920.1 hypothetical protein MSIM_03710 [Mycobacterium simiae]